MDGTANSFVPELGKSFIWMFGSVGGLIPSWGNSLLDGITNLGESITLQLGAFSADVSKFGLGSAIGSFFTDTLPA